jgi:hypothetical protein
MKIKKTPLRYNQVHMYNVISQLGWTHVSPREIHVGFVVKQSGTGTGFLQELRSFPVSYHSTSSKLKCSVHVPSTLHSPSD